MQGHACGRDRRARQVDPAEDAPPARFRSGVHRGIPRAAHATPPSARAASLSGLRTIYTPVARPSPSYEKLTAASSRPSEVSSAPRAPLIVASSQAYARPQADRRAALNSRTMARPHTGVAIAATLPPPPAARAAPPPHLPAPPAA